MSIHIGKLVQEEVESQRYTHREFASLIHLNEKTIPDVYERASMHMDLLLRICRALKRDFVKEYYTIEPLKSLGGSSYDDLQKRYDTDVTALQEQNKELIKAKLDLEKELVFTKELLESKKELINILKSNNLLEKQLAEKTVLPKS